MDRNPPVQHDAERNIWIVSRYEDVVQVMRDPDTFEVRLATMPGADRITHARVRRVIARAFAAPQVKALADLTRVRARELAEGFAARGQCELVADYAVPIALTVVGAMLGIDGDRFAELKRWSEAFLHTENPLLSDVERNLHRARTGECYAFMSAHLLELRQRPRGPYIAQYLTGEDDAEGLAFSEQVDIAMFLIIAGSETTSALIASSMLKLATDSVLQSRLRAEIGLIAPFIEEIIRHDAPVQRTRRLTACPAEIGGVPIPQSAVLEPLLGEANRDPEKFPDADQFRIDRHPNEHIGFGHGRHFCLGAQLARLEVAIAIETLLQRFPKIVLSNPGESVAFGNSFFVRAPTHLHLRFAHRDRVEARQKPVAGLLRKLWRRLVGAPAFGS